MSDSATISPCLCQKTMPWGNHMLGNSKYYIHAVGCFITVIAEILGVTPDQVNDRLKAINGYGKDSTGEFTLVIWAKIAEAFPGWSATFHPTYDNNAVLAALQAGQSVLVEVDAGPIGNAGGLHAVRFIGNHQLHDPWTGTPRPTSDFPGVKAFVVFTKTPLPSATATTAIQTPPVTPPAPSPTLSQQDKQAVLTLATTFVDDLKKLMGI